MEKVALFEAPIIDGSKFMRLKWLRYTLYIVLILTVSLLNTPVYNNYEARESVQQILDLDFNLIVTILIATGIITWCIFLYSISFKHNGIVEIGEQEINIKTIDYEMRLNFNEIKQLKIVRGSTYHYNHQSYNYLYRCNNLISFIYKGIPYQYEFMIDSQMRNSHFEKMIVKSKSVRHNFTYMSI